MKALGFDIGGANIKVSNGVDWHKTFPFALWRQPEALRSKLTTILGACPSYDRIAVTMTGELCDCFSDKQKGVESILDSATDSLGSTAKVYLVDGNFVSLSSAREQWRLAAAANWHLIASWAAKIFPTARGCVFDIGSTTTDIIPIANGRVLSDSESDLDRLIKGELVYTGASRTPVFGVSPEILLRNQRFGLATEWFATTLDAYLVLGFVPEVPADCDTADGRPATQQFARQRLARSLCCDANELEEEEIVDVARQILNGQLSVLQAALIKQLQAFAEPATIMVSGSGEWLATKIASELKNVSVLRFSDYFANGMAASSAAAAAALAQLTWIEAIA